MCPVTSTGMLMVGVCTFIKMSRQVIFDIK